MKIRAQDLTQFRCLPLPFDQLLSATSFSRFDRPSILEQAQGLEPMILSLEGWCLTSRPSLLCFWWRIRALNPAVIRIASAAITPGNPIPRVFNSLAGLEVSSPPRLRLVLNIRLRRLLVRLAKGRYSLKVGRALPALAQPAPPRERRSGFTALQSPVR